MRTRMIVVAAAALSVGLVSCSSSSGSPSVADLKEQFDKAGMSSFVDTQCLAEKVHDSGIKIDKNESGEKLFDAVSSAVQDCSNGKLPSLPTN